MRIRSLVKKCAAVNCLKINDEQCVTGKMPKVGMPRAVGRCAVRRARPAADTPVTSRYNPGEGERYEY